MMLTPLRLIPWWPVLGPCGAHQHWPGNTDRHSETQGPAAEEAAGGHTPVSLRGFSDKHSSASRPMWSSRDHTARHILVLKISKVTQSRSIRKFVSPLEKHTQRHIPHPGGIWHFFNPATRPMREKVSHSTRSRLRFWRLNWTQIICAEPNCLKLEKFHQMTSVLVSFFSSTRFHQIWSGVVW